MVTDKNNSTAKDYAPDFELPGIDGQVHHLTRYLENFNAIVIVFMNNECPYVKMYLDRLKQIQTEFAANGFTIIGINATDVETTSEDILKLMGDYAFEQNLNFPYIRDSNQDVARCFGVTSTPEVFLIDKSGKICYSGAIDDSPEAPEAAKKTYLRDSIAAVLENNEVIIKKTNPIGCEIKWRN